MNIDELLDRADLWLHPCPSCDAGLTKPCTCPPGDPRAIISDLARAVAHLYDEKAQREARLHRPA